MPDSDLYMSIGELANIYEISKQTLIYYATSGVLKPAFIEKNGYRYFSVNEFLELEIILNLRKLNLPAKDIEQFLADQNTDALKAILEERKHDCQKKIAALNHTIDSIQRVIDDINSQDELILDCFQTTQLPATKLIVSKPFDENSSKTHIPEFTSHNLQIFPKTEFRSAPTGWIIDREVFLSGRTNHSKCFFTPMIPGRQFDNVIERPAGLYVLLYFRGTYYNQSAELRESLLDYLKRNGLEMLSDVYNLPIKNHWQTKNSEDYINLLTVQVKYCK